MTQRHVLQADPPHLHQITQSLQQSIINFLSTNIYIPILIELQTFRTVPFDQQKNNADLLFATELEQVENIFALGDVWGLFWLLVLVFLLVFGLFDFL